MEHHFRSRLLRGDLLVGTMVTLGSPAVAEILAGVGFDWLFLDAEHGTFETHDLQGMLQGAGVNTPCVVRLASAEEVPIKKALDIGAAGIIAPQVNSAEHAEKVVKLSKYAPMGIRGVGIGRAHGYGMTFQDYVEAANEETAIIIQAEHIDAVDNIESIVQVPGIDAVLIGPYDLSGSLGIPGEVTDPLVTDAIDHVTKSCIDAGVCLGIFGMSATAVKPYIERGFTLIVAGVDTAMLGNAAKAVVSTLKYDASQEIV